MAKYVKFNAQWPFQVREITQQEWASTAGLDHPTVTWNQANNWMVPLSAISDEAFPYIEADRELSIVDMDKDDAERTMTVTEQLGTPVPDVGEDEVSTQTTGGKVITDGKGSSS